MPSNICGLPGAIRAERGVRHAEGREQALLGERRGVLARSRSPARGRASGSPSCCTPRPCPGAASCPRPIANAVRSRRGEQSHVVDERAPLAAGVVAQQVAHGDGRGLRPLPLRDPRRRALADAQVAVVLGDPDQRARDRLGHRVDVLRRVRPGAAEVPLTRELAVAHDDEAVRLSRLSPAPRSAFELRRVEPDRGGRDLLPPGARLRRAGRGRERRRSSAKHTATARRIGRLPFATSTGRYPRTPYSDGR